MNFDSNFMELQSYEINTINGGDFWRDCAMVGGGLIGGALTGGNVIGAGVGSLVGGKIYDWLT